ncbi:uncharacterized protein LOC133929597 [Phragmites australis]|uniref:uncharacterized protein LOC133929597 n=1 Tax=Phragmites australis TaxID=29695 RepID=UPI002D77C89F|nr:uncharacterized protein LOC133929597 [Phragmites australis]
MPELRGMLRVVTGMDDLSQAELPWKEMVLCANPDQVAIQAKLPEFDAQGLVDLPRRWSPETIETPGVDEAAGEEAASGPAQTGGPGATRGEPQASSRAAVGSSRRTGGGGTVGSEAATAPEDRGKCPRLFIPVPESPPSPLPSEGGSRDGQSSSVGPSAVAASAVLEPHFGLLGPDSAPGDHTVAPPPTGATESQGRPEAPRLAPALEPSAPKPSAPAEPGMVSAAAEPGPTDAAAETKTQPPPERSAPSDPAPSAPSLGRVTAW